MNKASSVLAAFDAGKLPSTQQFDRFVTWLNDVGLTNIEPSAQTELSSQGRILANDIRQILDAYKNFLDNKNRDNILQEAIWHLSHGDLSVTTKTKHDRDQALKDIHSLQRALWLIIRVAYDNTTTEGAHLLSDFASVARLMFADAAEIMEIQAGKAKTTLRNVEQDFQEGKRDSLGRDKGRVEAEKDVKVAWEHGMDTVRDTGSLMIGATQTVSTAVEDKSERTSSRLRNTFNSICDRAQADPAYRHSLDTIFTILQKRIDQGLETVSDPNFSVAEFIADTTPEQHVPKALENMQVFFERIANVSFDSLLGKLRSIIYMVVRDQDLKTWFHESLGEIRRDVSEAGYVRSEAAARKWKELHNRWKTFLESDEKWKANVDALKEELRKAEQGIKQDKDLNCIKKAHQQFNHDVERGLVDASREAETGLQAAMEQVTWFWQDLFKVYLPRLLSKTKDVPIPRIEYKDQEMELVLENLDISSFHILPSHVYIRNITDIDIQTTADPSQSSRTSIGTLTHVRAQAVQLTLNDVSFWYKDKSGMGPGEFTGLLHFDLPQKGLDIDIKLRLIPATVKGAQSRENLKHFHVIEKLEVNLAEDIGLAVQDTNHSILVALFKPIVVTRLRQALERTLTEQVRATIEWVDGVAFDVAKRKEVFQDTGLNRGGSLLAAIWSETGRIQREASERGELSMHSTGTGLVVEHHTYSEQGEEVGKSTLAMGAEPQVLSGEKRGPLGTASVPLKEQVENLSEAIEVNTSAVLDTDVHQVASAARGVAAGAQEHVQELVKEGKARVSSFKYSVEDKAELEKQRPGWQSAAFDF